MTNVDIKLKLKVKVDGKGIYLGKITETTIDVGPVSVSTSCFFETIFFLIFKSLGIGTNKPYLIDFLNLIVI